MTNKNVNLHSKQRVTSLCVIYATRGEQSNMSYPFHSDFHSDFCFIIQSHVDQFAILSRLL